MPLHPFVVRLRWWSRPWLTWLVAVVLALTTALVADALVQGARRARDDWGRGAAVLVATRAVAAGEVVGPDAAHLEERPAGVVPTGAADADDLGRIAAAALVPGEVVVTERLAPDALSPLAATVPAGHRAVAVPIGPVVPALVAGDRVDLVVAVDPTTGEGRPAVTIARAVVVLATTDEAVTVAVDADRVELVVAALASGAVVPALVGAG